MYAYDRMFFVRFGAKRTIGESLLGAPSSSAENFSAGAGVVISLGITTASLDYAFANYDDLGVVNRITVAITY